MRRSIPSLLGLAAVLTGLVLSVGARQLHAEADSTLTLSATEIQPGGTITITANFTANATGELPGGVGIEVRRLTGTGLVDFSDGALGPGLFGCPINRADAGVQNWCVWSPVAIGSTTSQVLTVQASADADGRWEVRTVQFPPSGSPFTSAGATTSFVVSAGTATTVAPDPTPTSTTALPSVPSTSPGGGQQLPGTGSRRVLPFSTLGAYLVAIGVAAIAVSRRRRGVAAPPLDGEQ